MSHFFDKGLTGPTKNKWRSAIEKHNHINFLRSKNRKLSRKPIARKIIARKCARDCSRAAATNRHSPRWIVAAREHDVAIGGKSYSDTVLAGKNLGE